METPTDLTNYLSPERTVCGLAITSRKRLFEQLAELLAIGLIDQDEKRIFRKLVEREKLGSTGVGDGVAIPHCRIEGLHQPRIAAIQLAEPIEYGARDKKPISLAFALVVPMEATDAHLSLLAALAQCLTNSEIRKKLHIANTSQQLIDGLGVSVCSRVAG